jgi:UDP-glucose 4-epimerase
MSTPSEAHRRVVVTGASGNVGTGVLRALTRHLPDAEVIGVCRRPPSRGALYERVRWHAVDLSAPDAALRLAPAMRGTDVVIHLALSIQPVRDREYLYRANVLGTQAVLDAMTAVGISQLVYASSLGVYAPNSGAPVSEAWSTAGQPSSTYSQHKVMVEHLLDRFERAHPNVVVARFRPTVVVQREAASMIRSLYLGPLVPRAAFGILRRRALPVLPLPAHLALQFVHADDVGDAVVLMMRACARGSFNIAADILDSAGLAALTGARPVAVNPRAMRLAVTALSGLRLVALTGGWYDVATNSPLMDTTRAHEELGWSPTWSSTASARELIDGLADGVVGDSAAMGFEEDTEMDRRKTVDRVHDATLLAWWALSVARATGAGRFGSAYATIIAANLTSGSPTALARLRARRRDPVAVVAPAAVGAAVLASRRGGWAPVVATAVLGALTVAERRRSPTPADARDWY